MILQDLRFAIRSCRRAPLFYAGIIAVLALGIGANGAIFSLVQAVLLEPLPYERPDQLVRLWSSGRDAVAAPLRRGYVADVAVTRWRDDGAAVLADVAGANLWDGSLEAQFDLVLDDRAERLRGGIVTPNFFTVLGATAALGRTFTNEDDAAGRHNLVVLSHRLWQRAFGGDPGVIGRTVVFVAGRADREPKPFVVIGVLPAAFRFTYPQETELWTVYPWSRVSASRGRAIDFSGGVGRLRPGVSIDAARSLLAPVSPEPHDIPPEYRSITFVEPMADWVAGEAQPALLLLAGVAALLLVIACATVGNALLVRLAERQRELALRASLGAGRLRLMRQLGLEGLVLATAGTAAGSIVAIVLLPLLRSLVPPLVPRADAMSVNLWFVVFAAGLAIAVTLFAALVPAVHGSRVDLLTILKQSAAASSSRSALRWRGALMLAQTCVATALLACATLLLFSFWRLSRVDLGYDAPNVTTVEIRLLDRKYIQLPPGERWGSPAVVQFQDDLLARVRAIPGVIEAGLTTAVPFRGVDFLVALSRDGKGQRIGARARSVDPAYFSVMRLRLLRGRLLTDDDTRSTPRVAVVSASFAKHMFGADDPLGQTFDYGGPVQVVGVVDDVRYSSFAAAPEPAIYRPRQQAPAELICLVVRTSGEMPHLAAALRRAVHEVDPAVPAMNVTTIDRILSDSIADRRFYTATTSAFAALALVLTSTGLIVVLARSIAERRRELAIRTALGAPVSRLMAMIARQGLILVLTGALIGLVVARAGAALLQQFLFEVDAREPIVYALAMAVALLVAAVACLVPVRHIASIPPATVLRAD